MINGDRRKLGQTPVASPRDRFCARSALLPMRKGLPAAPKGRRLDPPQTASGESRLGQPAMDEAGERYQECRDTWNDHNARQEFEHELINRKTNWWLTTQTILFAAYGLTLSNDFIPGGNEFRYVIAFAGLAMAVVTFVGVLAIINSKRLAWKLYAKYYKENQIKPPPPINAKPLQWGVNTHNTWLTLAPDVLLPFIFGVAWVLLLT
jgi:hypothetical protein